VILNISSEENRGNERVKNVAAVKERTNSACNTFGGIGRIAMPWMLGAARMDL